MLKKKNEKLIGQIEGMMHTETIMLEQSINHDKVMKKLKNLEQQIFVKDEHKKELDNEIEKLEFENQNLKDYKKECQDLNQTLRLKEMELTDIKLELKDQKRLIERYEMKNLNLEDRNSQWMAELIKLRAKVIELEHVNKINIQNNRLIFNAQRIEFSRMNLGKKNNTK